jgi:transcription elongation GreA/GreB family factor
MLDASREAHAAAVAAAMAHASRELRYWSARRASARVIPDPRDTAQVRFGSSVIQRGRKGTTFRIVGEDEPDPEHGTISHVSPLST